MRVHSDSFAEVRWVRHRGTMRAIDRTRQTKQTEGREKDRDCLGIYGTAQALQTIVVDVPGAY